MTDEDLVDPMPELPDNTPIDRIRFPARIQNGLAAAGLKTIGEVREAIKSPSPDLARLRQMTSDLQQIAYGLTSAPRTRSAGGGGGQGDGGSSGNQDDVVDAEFKEAS